jgi:hypothetical protein
VGDERLQAIQELGYIAYCGTYEVDDATVVHHVEMVSSRAQPRSAPPNTGHQGRLILTTLPSVADGGSQEDRLTWQRAHDKGEIR